MAFSAIAYPEGVGSGGGLTHNIYGLGFSALWRSDHSRHFFIAASRAAAS
jgi:hypothetical protein